MERAELLANGLNLESERWNLSNNILNEKLTNLTGNIIIAAAYVAYLGPFTILYRNKMI